MVTADGHNGVLAMFPAEVHEGGVQIEGVPHHDVEEAAIEGKHPLQQPFGRRFFAFAGQQQFHVQRHRQVMPDQMTDHAAVIVLGHLLLVDGKDPGLALGTTAFPAGEKTRGRPRPQSTDPRRWPTPCCV